MPEETFGRKGSSKTNEQQQVIEQQGLTKAIPLVICKDTECDKDTKAGCMHSRPHVRNGFCGYYGGCKPCEDYGIDLMPN